MLLVYIGALVVAAGVLAMQLVFGHHGGGDAHTADHGGADHDASVWTFLASVRFWAFALLAFGLVGSLTTVFGFAGSIVTAILAIACGLASGVAAVSVIRRLTQKSASSHATLNDVVGRVGRVIVPPNTEGRLKIRVEIKGSSIDYVGRSSDPVTEGESVIVEDTDGVEVSVSRAPKELKP